MSDQDGDAPSLRAIDRSKHPLLVVNDDPISRYTTVRMLNAAGFPTYEAGTGGAALDAATSSLSAIVLDVHLPDIDGLEVCRRLRARRQTARLPVIHLTASYMTDEDKVRGLDAGADAYLTHPVEPAVLVSTIQALVRTREAEEALRRTEAKFRAVYAQAPSGICLLEPGDGRIVDANPAMLSLLGRDQASVIGQRLATFVLPADEASAAAFFAGLATQRPHAEFALVDPQGRAVPLEWAASPDIEPGVAMAVATDISQRILLAQHRQELLDRERSARSSAERMSRMKDDLIAVLSHELRTPLNAIMGWTHVLQQRCSPDLIERGIAAIQRNVAVQGRLISDILDMSRLNVGKMPLSLGDVTAGAVIADAVSSIQPMLDEMGQRVVLDLEGETRVLHADSARLQQVLWNLLGNAAKFSPRGSDIVVRLRPDGDGLRFSVIDVGKGIEPDFLPHVFDRFSQRDVASNRQHGGLGLGLAIVKNLVEAHGGRVWVTSEGLGRGTSFEVWLPYAGSVAPAEPVDGPRAAGETGEREVSLQGLSVHVVDDDHESAAMLKVILDDRGARVTVSPSADHALEVMASARPDVLICDIGMPGTDGYELIREVRLRERLHGTRHVPAIAFTAFTRDADRVQALAAGFDAHDAKPLRPMHLMQLIERLTGRGPEV